MNEDLDRRILKACVLAGETREIVKSGLEIAESILKDLEKEEETLYGNVQPESVEYH
jgi:hypothetical protein